MSSLKDKIDFLRIELRPEDIATQLTLKEYQNFSNLRVINFFLISFFYYY